jgi:hypothetical protein
VFLQGEEDEDLINIIATKIAKKKENLM